MKYSITTIFICLCMLFGCLENESLEINTDFVFNDFDYGLNCNVKNNFVVEFTKKGPEEAVSYLDSILFDKDYTCLEESDILDFSAQIMVDSSFYDLGLKQLKKNDCLKTDSPLKLVLGAKCYLGLGRLEECQENLELVIIDDDSFLFQLGNLYEVKKEKDMAIRKYERLYRTDTVFYFYVDDRIRELENGAELLDTIQWGESMMWNVPITVIHEDLY